MFARTLATAGFLAAAVGAITPAHADAPAFPDLSGYAPVNAADYVIAIPNTGRAADDTVYFLTPDGIACNFLSGSAGCTGSNFPGVPGGGEKSVGTDGGIQPTNAPITTDNTVRGQAIKTLPPFHSITVDGIICGVDDARMTACKDTRGRGFVLSPGGSGWLPHV